MKKIARTLAGVVLASTFLVATPAFAGQATPAFMQPEVLQAAVAMNLTDEQKPKFQGALSNLVNERTKAFNNYLRRNNQTGIARKMRSKTTALVKKMDAEVGEFLTEEQVPAYNNYRDLLVKYMSAQ